MRIFFNQHHPLQMEVQGHEKGGVPQRRLSTCSRPEVLWALHLWVQQKQQHNQRQTQKQQEQHGEGEMRSYSRRAITVIVTMHSDLIQVIVII